MMIWLSTVWVFIGICLLLFLFYQRRKIRLLRAKLKISMQKSAETGNFLTIFSRNIRDSKSSNDWLQVSARYVRDLVEAESACVYILRNNVLEPAGRTGSYPRSLCHSMEIREIPEDEDFHTGPSMGERCIVDVALTQTARLLDDPRVMLKIASGEHTIRLTSAMLTPLVNDGTLIGVMVAVNNRHPGQKLLNMDQFSRFRFVATQVVLAQNIVHVYDKLSEQQRISQELEFARNLQRSLLPASFPRWGQFSVCATSRSSKEVSGDFYDYVEIDENRLLIVIGDACGKGIPACMIMAMTRSFIRANIARFTTLKDLLIELNDNLYRDTTSGQYITLGICLLNRKESTLEYARAGHTPLIVYIREHLRIINPEGAGLGLLPSDITYFDTLCIEFSSEMQLLMFTDGINEAENQAGEPFGIERLCSIFRKSCQEKDAPQDIIARVMGAVDDFSKKVSSDDDQTMVIIKHS